MVCPKWKGPCLIDAEKDQTIRVSMRVVLYVDHLLPAAGVRATISILGLRDHDV